MMLVFKSHVFFVSLFVCASGTADLTERYESLLVVVLGRPLSLDESYLLYLPCSTHHAELTAP